MNTPRSIRLLLLACAVALFVTGSAFAQEALPDDDEEYLNAVAPVVADPIEGWNRAMHGFNDKFIDYVARPVSKGYTFVTPGFVRSGLKNFFHNAAFPVRFVNNLLQGRGKAAGVEMSRFVLNTTAGLGGFFDVARHHKPIVPVEDEDMGQTFGVWGMGEGFYVVWPFLGPSTARDTVGMVGDTFLKPTTYIKPWTVSAGVRAIDIVNDLDATLDNYDTLKNAAIEPYTSIRDAYVQYRQAQIKK